MSENASPADTFESPQYTGNHQTYDTSAPESLIPTIVDSLTAVTGEDPYAMSPLYDAIDPDALVQLFESTDTDSVAPMRVTFQMNDCDVTVTGQGDVFVRE